MRLVYGNPLVELSVSEDTRVAWIRRTKISTRGADPAALAEFAAAVAKLPAANMTVVVDTRDAPGRNDSEFEQTLLPQFNAVTDSFGRQALLVRTEVGRIQMQRILRERGAEIPIFSDEEEARRYAGST